MLRNEQDYAYARPSLTRIKLRRLQQRCGAPPLTGKRPPVRIYPTGPQRTAERAMLETSRSGLLPPRQRLEINPPADLTFIRSCRAAASGSPARARRRPRPTAGGSRCERIRAHVLVCFLALLLVRVAETRTGQSWLVLRRALRRLKLARLTSKDGRFDQRSELDAEQKALLRALNVAAPERVRPLSV